MAYEGQNAPCNYAQQSTSSADQSKDLLGEQFFPWRRFFARTVDTEEKCFTFLGSKAPIRSAAISRSVRPVATPYLNTYPHSARALCAVSMAPLASILRSTASSSVGFISAMGRFPIVGKTSRSNRLSNLSA